MELKILLNKKDLVVMTGEFTKEDLKKIAKVLREIEQEKPEKTFWMWIDAKEMSREEATKLIKDIFPYKNHD